MYLWIDRRVSCYCVCENAWLCVVNEAIVKKVSRRILPIRASETKISNLNLLTWKFSLRLAKKSLILLVVGLSIHWRWNVLNRKLVSCKTTVRTWLTEIKQSNKLFHGFWPSSWIRAFHLERTFKLDGKCRKIVFSSLHCSKFSGKYRVLYIF